MKWIVHSWQGSEELWRVIWIYGAFFIFLARVAGVAIRLATGIDMDNLAPADENQVTRLQVIYGVWLLVALWRCAFNVRRRIWGYLTRISVAGFIFAFGALYFLDGEFLDPWAGIANAVDFARAQWN